MSSNDSRGILIFTKPEERGKVKTRLRPALSEAGCLELHIAMLKDTMEACLHASADVQLYVAGAPKFSFPISLPIRSQAEGDLGRRMSRAFAENFKTYSCVLIVGTDAPGLTPELLEAAMRALSDHDLVLGPSDDGGYYLVGMRRLIPEIFENMEWSTSTVLQNTLARAAGHKVSLLPPLYDIDLPEDLARLEKELNENRYPHAVHTRAWFAGKRP